MTYNDTPRMATSCDICNSFIMEDRPPVYELLQNDTVNVLKAIYARVLSFTIHVLHVSVHT